MFCRYRNFAYENFKKSKPYASGTMKQAVIAPSMLYLLYPLEGELEGYSRDQFTKDLINEVGGLLLEELATLFEELPTIETVESVCRS
jgi:hypothetical protein